MGLSISSSKSLIKCVCVRPEMDKRRGLSISSTKNLIKRGCVGLEILNKMGLSISSEVLRRSVRLISSPPRCAEIISGPGKLGVKGLSASSVVSWRRHDLPGNIVFIPFPAFNNRFLILEFWQFLTSSSHAVPESCSPRCSLFNDVFDVESTIILLPSELGSCKLTQLTPP